MSSTTQDFENAQERLRSIIDTLQQQNDELHEELLSTRAEDARAQKELEKANRSGERGRDWQILQSRIDLNQTTMKAIIGGEDASSEATRVRELTKSNLQRLNEEIERQSETDPDEKAPREEARELLDDLNARVQQFKLRFGQI